MTKHSTLLNLIVTAFLAMVMNSVPLAAQTTKLDQLFEDLALEPQPAWKKIEETIWIEWSKSGSPAADLLLQRGRDAMDAEDYSTAVEHFTALTDHAPLFAEGFNARATAYYRMSLYGPALEDIQNALSLNPRHFGAMQGLGLILEELEMKPESLDIFRKAAAIHPHRPTIKEAIERLVKEVEGQKL